MRAQNHDSDAWQQISHLYVPVVYAWVRRAGLQPEDASDVAQEVFRIVIMKLSNYRRQNATGSFRSWLRSITNHKLQEFFRRQKGVPRAIGGSAAHEQFQEVECPQISESDGETELSRSQLAHRALELIRSDFQESTWKAFLRVVIDGQKATDVAEELNLSPKAVRQAKCRVLHRLRSELDGLD